MPVQPTLNSIVICDSAILDAETRKRSLIGIFQNIRATQFPHVHPMMTVYASVTDAHGDYVFSLRLVQVESDKELWKAQLPQINIPDPLHSQEICIRMMRLAFPDPGRYELQFSANDQLLDLRRITLEKVDPNAPGQQPGQQPGPGQTPPFDTPGPFDPSGGIGG